jgi:hypothetical protein
LIYSISTAALLSIPFLWGCTIKEQGKNQEERTNQEQEVVDYPPAEILSGTYRRVDIPSADPEPIALGVIGVVIDRQNYTAVFRLSNGSEINQPLRVSDSPDWGLGCPTNHGATPMEILPFAVDRFTLDGVIFNQPILVATCSTISKAIVLRETGPGLDDILPAVACDWWTGAKCIYFSNHGEQ